MVFPLSFAVETLELSMAYLWNKSCSLSSRILRLSLVKERAPENVNFPDDRIYANLEIRILLNCNLFLLSDLISSNLVIQQIINFLTYFSHLIPVVFLSQFSNRHFTAAVRKRRGSQIKIPFHEKRNGIKINTKYKKVIGISLSLSLSTSLPLLSLSFLAIHLLAHCPSPFSLSNKFCLLSLPFLLSSFCHLPPPFIHPLFGLSPFSPPTLPLYFTLFLFSPSFHFYLSSTIHSPLSYRSTTLSLSYTLFALSFLASISTPIHSSLSLSLLSLLYSLFLSLLFLFNLYACMQKLSFINSIYYTNLVHVKKFTDKFLFKIQFL